MATQVAVDDLESWLQSKPANTVDTPYEIEVTGITSAKLSVFSQGLSNNTNKYVDLSETQMPLSDLLSWYLSGLTNIVEPPKLPTELTSMNGIFQGCTALKHGVTEIPEGVTDMNSAYKGCVSLVSAVIPEGVTNISSTFNGCLSLTEAPVIPNGVTLAYGAFNGCSSLTTAPELPSSVVNIREIFKDCTSLIYAPLLPNGVLYVQNAFENCSALREKPILPSSVTVSTDCFKGVTTSNWKGTESQAESFLSTFFAQTVDSELQVYNNDRVTYEESIYNIDISTLSTYLAGLDPNTVSTAYKIYIRGLTTSNASDIRVALLGNRTKYVDLSYTIIPDNTDCTDLFLDNNPLNEENPLVYAPVLPAVNTNTQLTSVFAGCNNLQEAPVIPNIYTSLQYAFSNCISLTQTPEIPVSVTNTQGAFMGCLALTTVQNLPSNVVFGSNAFKNCSSLTKIDEFKIPINTLKNNTNFQDMFAGCSSLTQVGYKIEQSDNWHVFSLAIGGSTVEGTVYGVNENSQITTATISQTSITKSSIRLPVLTDELWFPSGLQASEIEDVIEDMLSYKYGVFNKQVIPPNDKQMVIWADEDENHNAKVVTNIASGIEVETVSASKTITPTKDKRVIVDTASITVTLAFGVTNGITTEVFAMQACTVTYYTAQGTTASLSMASGSKAVFIYYSGWKLHSNYGTTNSVTVDNMQSVSSNAVAQAFNGFIKSYDVDYGTITVSANNYIALPEILPNKTIIGFNLKYWLQNSGCFSLQIYHPNATRNVPHLIANNGVTVSFFQVTYYYID